jgi:penicillin amidase
MRANHLAPCLLAGAVLAACSSSGKQPASLSVAPSGTVEATGPVLFTATVTGGNGVAWALSGPGSLSGSEGRFVTYRPPAVPGVGQTATLTATSGQLSQVIHLTLGPAALTPKALPALSAAATVIYDAWQVPHVHCAVDLDCFVVQGYLHARDRLFQMDFLRRVARGQLAELVGPLGLEQDLQLRTLFTMRDGGRIEDALVAAMDDDTRARVQAYVDGVNARLDELTAAELPGEYLQLPVPVTPADIRPWELEDVTGLARLQQFQLSESIEAEADYGRFALAYGPGAPLFGGGGKITTWIRAQQPVQARTYTLVAPPPGLAPSPAPTPSAASLSPWAAGLGALGTRMGALRDALHAQVGEVGSNNWVVDAGHSATGHAMVANDPHLALPYPPNFYLAALTSARAADNMDVVGGSFPGTPGALVGRGKNVGWGVTVVGYDVTDLYQEQVVPPPTCPADALHPFCVLTGTGLVRVLASPQTYRVRAPDGSLQDAAAWPAASPLLSLQETLVFVVPHHGPIIQAPDAGGHAISMRWTGHEGWTQDLRAFLRLGTAANVAAAIEALKDYATGAQNFVLADDQGHVAYDPHALIPVRDFADVRVTAPDALLPPWFPLPGDGSAEWGSDPACAGVAAPRSCFLSDDDVPHGTDPAWGFYVTANSDPVGVSDDNNPLAHPPYLSFDWSEFGFRHSRITERLAALTAGGGKVSRADLEAIQADHVSTLGRAFTQILSTSAFDAAAGTSADFADARALLEAWGAGAKAFDCPTGLAGTDPVRSPPDPDAANGANSAACLLFHTFLRDLLVRVFADDLRVAGLGVSSGPAVKGMLRMLEPGVSAGEQSFCDDVDVTGTVTATHTCGEQVVSALVTAFRLLEASTGPVSDWRWGRVHTFTAQSQFPTVTTGFVAGPFARPGGALTVDVGNPRLTASGPSFAFGSSANVRHVSVMDPAGPSTRMQLPGPERDGPYDVLAGPDLLVDWVNNSYFDYADWAQVQAGAVATQAFTK